MQALLVLGPHVRRDGTDFERRVRHNGGNDVVQRGGDEAHGAVGRQQAERLDVQVLGDLGPAVWGADVDVGLDAADEAADGFGVGAIVGPGDDAGEAAGDGVGGAVVEGLGVVDGEEESVEAAEGVDVGGGDGADGGFAG